MCLSYAALHFLLHFVLFFVPEAIKLASAWPNYYPTIVASRIRARSLIPDQPRLTPYNSMADHRALSRQANPILGHIYPALHWLHGQNPHVAEGDQQGGHWDGAPQPVRNVGGMQYPDAPNYNVAHYYPPPPPYPAEVPNVHMHRDVGGVEVVPAQAHLIAPDVQDNRDGIYGYGYGARLPAAHPLEAYPGVQPHAAPPADMPPANGLRNLASRFLNNPDTLVNMLRIEPGPGGRFMVWIELELADI